jgi:Asp-tRNA(Asn)/Glu-tRNA(Gln) amidotransferase A subunit family amidase
MTTDRSGEIARLTACEIREAILNRRLSSVEVVEAYSNIIQERNLSLNAFVEEDEARARQIAREVDARVAAGCVLPLAGVPYGVKDTTDVAGIVTTNGSESLKGAVAGRDAMVVERLRAAGGVFMGKTNTPEFGARCTTAFGAYGATRNPWRPLLSAGGSSGGSAAAVASHMVPIAQGSDGGGSIRIPASCCGVVGYKPSRGRIPNYPDSSPRAGLIVQGVLARSVRDVAMCMDVLAGAEAGEPYCLVAQDDGYLGGLDGAALAGSRLGLVGSGYASVDAAVKEGFDSTLSRLEAAGCTLVETDVEIGGLGEVYRVVLEADLGLLERPPEGFTDAYVDWCWERGRNISSGSYLRALRVLSAQGSRIARATREVDALVTPTLTALPGPVETFQAEVATAAALDLEFTAFTYPFNASGQPAISLPLSASDSGVPIGIQFIGPPGEDRRLLRLAAAIELAVGGFPDIEDSLNRRNGSCADARELRSRE